MCEAVCASIYNAINYCTNEASIIDVDDATKIAFESTEYIISYLTKQDLIDINAKICILFLDWDNISIPRIYRYRCLVESKILYNFIKNIDNNFNISLRLPFSVTDDNELREFEEYFDVWLRMCCKTND